MVTRALLRSLPHPRPFILAAFFLHHFSACCLPGCFECVCGHNHVLRLCYLPATLLFFTLEVTHTFRPSHTDLQEYSRLLSTLMFLLIWLCLNPNDCCASMVACSRNEPKASSSGKKQIGRGKVSSTVLICSVLTRATQSASGYN